MTPLPDTKYATSQYLVHVCLCHKALIALACLKDAYTFYLNKQFSLRHHACSSYKSCGFLSGAVCQKCINMNIKCTQFS